MRRPAAVAGTWYSRDAAALRRDVDAYLADAADPPAGTILALMAPHAGLMFSGPVAAWSYKAASAGAYEAIVLVGPSHFAGFDGIAVYPEGAFETPLGPAAIDAALADRLLKAGRVMHPLPDVHGGEHSLEMQLPFVRRLWPDTPIVPLLMGYQTRETIIDCASALASGLAGSRALLVASTDLSHYFDAARAMSLDARVRDCVAAFDADRLLELFERYPAGERGRYVACGGGPAIAVMRAARALGGRDSVVLKYAHSGDVSGDHHAVVGYLAAAFGVLSRAH
ncbi:MAG TPA: AmmeMemoRadiSam system protein B [Vicinamibacterales bacterium]|nr:AmmeMemoRadiSam system protein B [Vicinamibacterales bacterium]